MWDATLHRPPQLISVLKRSRFRTQPMCRHEKRLHFKAFFLSRGRLFCGTIEVLSEPPAGKFCQLMSSHSIPIQPSLSVCQGETIKHRSMSMRMHLGEKMEGSFQFAAEERALRLRKKIMISVHPPLAPCRHVWVREVFLICDLMQECFGMKNLFPFSSALAQVIMMVVCLDSLSLDSIGMDLSNFFLFSILKRSIYFCHGQIDCWWYLTGCSTNSVRRGGGSGSCSLHFHILNLWPT